jgi:sarcosine oxidase/L-pipecolate oxidase
MNSMNKDSNILIVGAGVFGLSTALHLTKRGYTNVHVFDKQPYHSNHYAYSEGADAASADENKILRASYGGARMYQDLAFKAMDEWQKWNDLLADTPGADLPECLTPETKLWDQCGFLRLSGNGGLEKEEILTQANFPAELRGTQYRVSDAQRRMDAERDGLPRTKSDTFGRLEKGLPTDGILDATAGYVLASRACAFALHLCVKAGMKTYLGPEHALQSLLYGSSTKEMVTGIKMKSGVEHTGDYILLACGGWTPSLLPSTLSPLLETTSGSVLSIRLPNNRPDLWDKFASDKFPVWSWNMGSYTVPGKSIGGIYGLPRTPEGVVKIAFRGAKWTSYTYSVPELDKPLSYPKTDLDAIPEEAMRVLRTFTAENLPELLDLPLETARLCWYTDSVDNSFLISQVPKTSNLFVASGGSGHGFKFLPVLGEHIVDVLERKDTAYTRLFAWREVPAGKRNGLEEGSDGWRVLERQRMVGKRAWSRGYGSSL